MTTFLDAAIAYASRDLFVFPCLPRSKAPDGMLVPHGVKQSTNELARIRRWWNRAPHGNVAIAIGLGTLFGVRVLDVDPKHGGDRVLDDLLRRHGQLPAAPSQRSGSGGLHVLLRWPSGNWVTKLVSKTSGLELLGPGRYFMADPSVHPDTGARYQWTTPLGTEIPAAPAWLLEIARRKDIVAPPTERPPVVGARYARGALLSAAQRVESAADGDRNNELNREAFGLSRFVRSGELSEDLVRRVLVDAARVAGLSAFEADRTISSALRARKAL
jgi:hypothetical protein